MSHLVVINLGIGDLQRGCENVIAQVSSTPQDPYTMKCVGSLPPAPDLEALYRRWHLLYQEFYRGWGSPPPRAITIASGGVTHFSEVELSDLAQQLKRRLNLWLNSESFHPVDRKLSRSFDPGDEIRVIIETNDPLLRRLPWHLWNFFEDFPRSEVALSVAEYERLTGRSQTAVGRVRILAILGNSDQIDLQSDRQVIESLPQSEPVFLQEPTYQTLHEYLWDERGWDILFFAGHSQTEDNTGRIFINATESLTLDQLRHALTRAIRQGLKLAIFNSCDGLGLAQALADLQIPQVIVMRELVADRAAQSFFRHFLTTFARHQSLYSAVREARERLEQLENEYPCSTWLPVICQNPAEPLVTWSSLQGRQQRDRPALPRPRLSVLMLTTVLVTALVMGARQLGWLQPLELRAFDQLMQLRPSEPADPRLLLVTVTERDVQIQDPQERRGASLSDRALGQLLAKLNRHQPRAIGLDIYRDFPIDPRQSDLLTQLQNSPQFVAVCEVGETAEQPGTRPLEGVPSERLSFSDLPLDEDGVVRRQILGMAPSPQSFCVTDTSFSLRLSQLYFASVELQTQRDSEGVLQIGATRFPQLRPDSGGYHSIDALGYQILLNYRVADPVAQQVTLSQILNGSLDAQLAELVRDRIVLIGTVAPSFKDYVFTPYSRGQQAREMPGVVVQAHMTSQILSAVLDGRSLLQGTPFWATVLWVWSGALVGGLLVLGVRSLPLSSRAVILILALGSGLALLIWTGSSFLWLLWGIWVPTVSSALALVASAGVGMVAVFNLVKVDIKGRFEP